MDEEKTILTRRVLFEKSPLRIKVDLKNKHCIFWYEDYDGEVFDVELSELNNYSLTIDKLTFKIIKGEFKGELLAMNDCKVLSGNPYYTKNKNYDYKN